nr:immunoglobulin heavy chain junction region [Mus musculus]
CARHGPYGKRSYAMDYW